MILVTGGTGFIGQALVRHLVEAGHQVRLLVRPSAASPRLPRGVPLDVVISSLEDERGLRAAMMGVDVIYHLAGAERHGIRANLVEVDIQGTQAIMRAAADARVERVFFLSHLGADRASAYPVFKAKAVAEEHVRRSGVDYTIVRSAIAFGANDRFTTGLAQLLHTLPFVFLLPGDGSTLIQPIWVEDLATCLTWALDETETRNQVIEIGGPEYFTFQQAVQTVMNVLAVRRRLIPTRLPYLRALTLALESLLPALPISVYWLDYLAVNRTCALDSVPRTFHLMPSRFSQRLAYLRKVNWRGVFWRMALRRKSLS